jgi:type II secretory pathway component PulM
MNPRDRRAVTLGAAVLLPALCFTLVVRPFVHARTALRERLREQHALLARELTLVAAASRLPEQVGDAAHVLRVASPRLLPGDAFAATATLLHAVGDAARQHDVFIEAIEGAAPEDAGDGLVAVQINLRGRGDLEGLLRWLTAIESGDRLLRVERLGIARLSGGAAGDSKDVETLTLGATVRGYVLAAARGGGRP